MAAHDSARFDNSSFPLRHDLVGAMPEGLRQLLLSEAKRMSLRKGETLFSKGDRSDSAYYIREGIIKMSIVSPTGEQRIVALQSAGSTVGDLALIDGATRGTTAESMTDCELLVISRSAFRMAASSSPELHAQISTVLAKRLRSVVEEVTQGAFLPMRARIARALLRLVQLLGEHGGNDLMGIDHPIAQGDIAGMAGVTRESVNRTLTEWRGEGVLDSSPRHRMVLNVRRLFEEAARHE